MQLVMVYSETPLNRHPLNSGHPRYNGHLWLSGSYLHRLQYIENPWIADIPLLRKTDTILRVNALAHIVNNPHKKPHPQNIARREMASRKTFNVSVQNTSQCSPVAALDP